MQDLRNGEIRRNNRYVRFCHMNDIRIRHDFLAQVMLHLISHNISESNRPNKLFFICHNGNTGIGHLTKQEGRMIRIVGINQHS
ncbi:Uncharacterised protein [Streptococcus pneumoniae]|nr:Uncharacterised protein [Streptococcus pneumoniae]